MIQEFVNAWDENKEKLREYFSTHEQDQYSSYKKLFEILIKTVINPYLEETQAWYGDILHVDKITEIDDGEYQGSKVFIVPKDAYQPGPDDYICTYVYYGSCTVCDTLQRISQCEDELPTKEQVDEYMTLELHLLQKMKWIFKTDVQN